MYVLTQEEFAEAKDVIQRVVAVSSEEYPHAIPAFNDVMEEHHGQQRREGSVNESCQARGSLIGADE
jgi:hypothetical protein